MADKRSFMKISLDCSRRQALRALGGSVLLANCGGDEGIDLGLQPGQPFDQVLDRLHTIGPSFADGGANHAPMGAEVLEQQKMGTEVARFVEAYARRRPVIELSGNPALTPGPRPATMGDPKQEVGWISYYAGELANTPPRDLLLREWAALSRGYAASGLHGILRTAHAVRSLERTNTPSRVHELAHALGYWAAWHRPLLGQPGSSPQPGLDVVQALDQVPLVPAALRSGGGLIVDRMVAVDRHPPFADAIARVDLDAMPVNAAVTELVAAAARLFIADGTKNIGYLHAVTGSSALRLVLPWLDAPAQRLGLGYAFQSVAALYATHAARSGVPATQTAPARATVEQLSQRITPTADEHLIKLCEACLREHAVSARPEFLDAGLLNA